MKNDDFSADKNAHINNNKDINIIDDVAANEMKMEKVIIDVETTIADATMMDIRATNLGGQDQLLELRFTRFITPLSSSSTLTSKYCDNLRQLAHLFGEQSVLAVVPATLQGRALDWFGSSMLRHVLDSLED